MRSWNNGTREHHANHMLGRQPCCALHAMSHTKETSNTGNPGKYVRNFWASFARRGQTPKQNDLTSIQKAAVFIFVSSSPTDLKQDGRCDAAAGERRLQADEKRHESNKTEPQHGKRHPVGHLTMHAVGIPSQSGESGGETRQKILECCSLRSATKSTSFTAATEKTNW